MIWIEEGADADIRDIARVTLLNLEQTGVDWVDDE
jgi:hypothetical protein